MDSLQLNWEVSQSSLNTELEELATGIELKSFVASGLFIFFFNTFQDILVLLLLEKQDAPDESGLALGKIICRQKQQHTDCFP